MKLFLLKLNYLYSLCFFTLRVGAIALLASVFCYASQPPSLIQGADEERAQELFSQIKCMVCQGENIKESNSNFAVSMRKKIVQDIAKGKTNDEIINSLRQRFGEEIILRPKFNLYTFILWLAPIFLLLIGVRKIIK